MKKLLMCCIATASLLCVRVGRAEATSVSCPGALGGGVDRQFSLDTDPASICTAFGDNNVGGANDEFLSGAGAGWEIIDVSDDTTGTHDGWLTISTTPGGSFSIDPLAWSTYGQIALGLKDGNPGPKWAAFTLAQNVTGGTWNDTEGHLLGHAVLYGTGTPDTTLDAAAVPEPATLVLFGSCLGFIATRMKRRQS